MAKARAIVKRLKSVKNIRKITRTMELIATARFKKAMDRASEASAYTKKISEVVAEIAAGDVDVDHPLLRTPETTRNATLLVLTSNRGLAGGYNAGILRQALGRLREARREEESLRLDVVGKRGISYMQFQGESITEAYTHFEDRPRFEEVETLAADYIADFINRRTDRLDVAYMKFHSPSRQEAVVETLLPLARPSHEGPSGEADAPIDYEFLPSATSILRQLVPAAFKAKLFKCFLDAAVSEQIARMIAMKGATENADEMIGSLSQKYNRARQQQITSELSEIIGGAAALE